jgi:hypothetical protein
MTMRVTADKMGNNEIGSQGDLLPIFSYYGLISCADALFGLDCLCFNRRFRSSEMLSHLEF